MKVITDQARGMALGAITVGLVAAAFMLLGSGPAEAQQNTDPRQVGTVRVTYSARLVNAIAPTTNGDKVLKVHAFPNSPVFLVHTSDSINVWERRGNGLTNLLQIAIPSEANGLKNLGGLTKILTDNAGTINDIVFLDDGETFIVQTQRAAAVYRIQRNTTVN